MNAYTIRTTSKHRLSKSNNVDEFSGSADVEVKEQDTVTNGGIRINDKNVTQTLEDPRCMSKSEDCSRRPESCGPKQSGIIARNYARADPSYLKTLGQAHSGWLFGAIAELVDNSRDAKATKLVDTHLHFYLLLNLVLFNVSEYAFT